MASFLAITIYFINAKWKLTVASLSWQQTRFRQAQSLQPWLINLIFSFKSGFKSSNKNEKIEQNRCSFKVLRDFYDIFNNYLAF